MRQEIADYFNRIETEFIKVDEYEIGAFIRKVCNANNSKKSFEELAEEIAFSFRPGETNIKSDWGSYYNSQFRQESNGAVWEFPSLNNVNKEILDYWEKRFNETPSPVLKYTYSNLLIDFSPFVLKQKASHLIANELVNACVEIIDRDLSKDIRCIKKLARSLQIALLYNNHKQVQLIKKATIQLEQRFSVDHKGLWGFSFKWFINDNTGKIAVPENEHRALLTDLEKKLQVIVSADDPDPFAAEHAVDLLSEYYAKKKDDTNLLRVLLLLENAFKKNKRQNSSGLLILDYYERLSKRYEKCEKFSFAEKEQERITTEINNLGNKTKLGMKEIPYTFEIPKKIIDQLTNSFFHTDNPTLEQSLDRIAIHLIGQKENSKGNLISQAKDTLLIYNIPQTILSKDGYPIAKLNSLEKDFDNHLVKHFASDLNIAYFFLKHMLDHLRTKYSAQEVSDCIKKTPVFSTEDYSTIDKIFESYWKDDYYETCSSAILLIEEAVRNLFRIRGKSFIKKNKLDGFDVKSLGQLLGNDVIVDSFGIHGTNMQFHMQVLLTERLGLNLRNDFAHGLNKEKFHKPLPASWLIHIFLCFGILKHVTYATDTDVISQHVSSNEE